MTDIKLYYLSLLVVLTLTFVENQCVHPFGVSQKYAITCDFELVFLKVESSVPNISTFFTSSQPANTCSKLTIKIPEQGVKYVQS